MAGIISGGGAKPVSLTASGAGTSIGGSEAIAGSTVTLKADDSIVLTNPSNSFTAVDATASTGSVSLVNGNTGTTSLTGSASSMFAYQGAGLVTVQSVFSGSGNAGSTFGAGAVSIEAPSIQAGPGLNINAPGDGSVFLNALNGSIGTSAAPLAVDPSGGVWAQAAGTGGNIYLSNPNSSFPFTVNGLVASGSAFLQGTASPAGTLDLRNASTGGALDWSGFTGATLGSGGGTVSAGGAITANGDVNLAGTLIPGGVGSISTMSVTGQLQRAGRRDDDVRLQRNQL